MKIKMISSEEKEEWLKETYKYLQKLKECKYEDVRLDYIMLYELHEEEHKEIERLNNIITKLELYLINERINNWKVDEWTIMKIQNELEKLKEGK